MSSIPSASLPGKFAPPLATGVFLCERLALTLHESLGGIVWVIGPAGAGKTSLLASWAVRLERPVAWYRVDDQDRDPAGLFIALAAQLAALRCVANLPVFAAEHLLDIVHFARRFLRVFHDALPRDTVLVLDNCHAAGVDGAFVTLLGLLCDEKRSDVTIVASTRFLPPLLLGTLASPGVRLIDWGELRLTDAEASALGVHLFGSEPDADILRLADGWPAGLALLMRLRSGQLRTGIMPANTGARTFAVFGSEVFDNLPLSQRQLLLATACATRVTARLALYCGAPASAGADLGELWAAHFFIERLDISDGEPVYCYHPLLRAFLQERLASANDESALRMQCEQMADWHEERGEWVDAATLLALGEVWTRYAAVVLRLAPVLLQRGQLTELMSRIDAVPSARRTDFPALAYWHGLAIAPMAPRDARALLVEAMEGHCEHSEIEAAALACAAAIETYILEWEDWTPLPPWVDRLQSLCDALAHHYSSMDVEVRLMTCGSAIFMAAPDHPLLRGWIERARELVHIAPDPAHRLGLARLLIGPLQWLGEPRTVRRLVDIVAPTAGSGVLPPAASIDLLIWSGMTCYLDSDWPRAIVYFEEALAIGTESGVTLLDFHLHLHLMFAHLVHGDLPAALLARERALPELPRQGRAGRFFLDFAGLLLASHESGSAHACDVAVELLASGRDMGWITGRAWVRLAIGTYALHAGRLEQTRIALDDCFAAGEQLQSAFLCMNCHLLLAEHDRLIGSCSTSHRHLEEGMALVRELDYRLLSPWWIPDLVGSILWQACCENIELETAERLIRLHRLPAPLRAGSRWPWPIRIRVLGVFSLETWEPPLAGATRTSPKVLELIKMLASAGGRAVSLETLAGDLWPEAEGDAAQRSLDVTLHRARKRLGSIEALRVNDRKLSFNQATVWLDLRTLETCMQPPPDVRARPDSTGLGYDHVDIRLAERVEEWMSVFGGVLLEGEPEHAWLLAQRDRWSERLERGTILLASDCRRAGLDQLAERVHRHALDNLPWSEVISSALMRLLIEMGRHAEALRTQEILCESRQRSGLPGPSAATRRLLNQTW